MQAIVETAFDAVYLTSVIAIGILTIRNCRGNLNPLVRTHGSGIGPGDAFHLIPGRRHCVPLALGIKRLLWDWKVDYLVTMTVFMCCCTMCGGSDTGSKGGAATAAVYVLVECGWHCA
jgi:hypothetical protein